MSCHSLSKCGFNIILFSAWIQGYVSISDNTGANTAARESTVQGTLLPSILNLDFKTTLWSILAKWQRD
jgi:hypothetical protein